MNAPIIEVVESPKQLTIQLPPTVESGIVIKIVITVKEDETTIPVKDKLLTPIHDPFVFKVGMYYDDKLKYTYNLENNCTLQLKNPKEK